MSFVRSEQKFPLRPKILFHGELTRQKEQSSHVMLKVARNQFRRLISTHQLISR
jgi:hypothetical protein